MIPAPSPSAQVDGPPAAGCRISARVGGIAGSATMAVDAKAKALRAAGRPVIGSGMGEPDFPTTPGHLRLSYALSDDDLHAGVTHMGALLSETTPQEPR